MGNCIGNICKKMYDAEVGKAKLEAALKTFDAEDEANPKMEEIKSAMKYAHYALDNLFMIIEQIEI